MMEEPMNKRNITPSYPSNYGGRPCGCDPRAGHVCESHGCYVDASEARFINPIGDELTVSGPDENGAFTIAVFNHEHDGAALHVERFMAEDIVYELSRRLAERV